MIALKYSFSNFILNYGPNEKQLYDKHITQKFLLILISIPKKAGIWWILLVNGLASLKTKNYQFS